MSVSAYLKELDHRQAVDVKMKTKFKGRIMKVSTREITIVPEIQPRGDVKHVGGSLWFNNKTGNLLFPCFLGKAKRTEYQYQNGDPVPQNIVNEALMKKYGTTSHVSSFKGPVTYMIDGILQFHAGDYHYNEEGGGT